MANLDITKFEKTPIARLVLLAALVCYSLDAASWQIQAVDPGGGGKYSSFHFDSYGNAQVVYYDEPRGLLKYGFWDRKLDKWFTMTIDTASGFCSMVLDSRDRPHVSYIEHQTGRLKYAHWDGSQWLRQTIPIATKSIDYYTSIALDRVDQPAITFYDYGDAEGFLLHLRIVRLAGSVWELRTIDGTPGSGKFNSLVRDNQGNLRVGYANVKEESHSIRYAYESHGSWKIEVPEGVGTANEEYLGWSAALAMDFEDRPHIVYFNETRHQVKYATKDNGQWRIETVDNLLKEGYPDRNSIALDEQGEPYVSYYDAGQGVLKVAHRLDNRWITEVVDENFSGFTSSIQVRGGEIAVTYWDEPDNTLKFARRPVDARNAAANLKVTKEAK